MKTTLIFEKNPLVGFSNKGIISWEWYVSEDLKNLTIYFCNEYWWFQNQIHIFACFFVLWIYWIIQKINAIPSSDWILFTKKPVATFYSVGAASDGSFGIYSSYIQWDLDIITVNHPKMSKTLTKPTESTC